MDKPTLRRELRALSRERLTDELRLTGSASIISQLRQHPLWQQAQHVALYAALPDEPNLRTLIDEVATTKQVYLPRVLDGETMDFFAFAGWQELEQSGSFGIYEPRLE
ncbi:MAG: 5-formyltetrahydrofolate cyclo-ligase, partial [Porphyromonadaceae bacterium]|nr:5-formyltetrahydrofolate cyclo-ligase [Porphyromonadaceae bacterium]